MTISALFVELVPGLDSSAMSLVEIPVGVGLKPWNRYSFGFAFGIASRERKKVKAHALLSLFFPSTSKAKKKDGAGEEKFRG